MSFINDILNAPQALGNQAASAYDSALAASQAREATKQAASAASSYVPQAATVVTPVVETVAPEVAPRMNPAAKAGLVAAGVVGAIGLIGWALTKR